jgi:nanoRNase/pAp phosphatase (c-di-AMP/oligoRNAs hydrolase)
LWSLRSRDDREDVSEIAASFGGGGHRNAAGFRFVGKTVDDAQAEVLAALIKALKN